MGFTQSNYEGSLLGLGERWSRRSGDLGIGRTCVEAARTIAAIAVLANDGVEFVLGDVTLATQPIDIAMLLEERHPPLPRVSSLEFPGHIVALLGPQERRFLLDLTAGQFWSESPFVQMFESAVRGPQHFDEVVEVGPPQRTLGVHYFNVGVYVAVRGRPDLPCVDLTPNDSHFDLASLLLADGN